MTVEHLSRQVVLLPKQLDRLAEIAAQTGAAIGIAQTGSTIHVNTGIKQFDVDAYGEIVQNSNQEKLC